MSAVRFATLGMFLLYSRPLVKNDHPYIESLFKTVKSHASYAGRLETIEAAREWLGEFMHWYNIVYRHSGIEYVTPEQRRTGQSSAQVANLLLQCLHPGSLFSGQAFALVIIPFALPDPPSQRFQRTAHFFGNRCDCSPLRTIFLSCSTKSRTAPSRNSAGYLPRFAIDPILSQVLVSGKPGAVHFLTCQPSGGKKSRDHCSCQSTIYEHTRDEHRLRIVLAERGHHR